MSDIETIENGIDRQSAYVRVGEIVMSAKTLRDEFAMAALASLGEECAAFMAADAYKIADAMMEARKS